MKLIVSRRHAAIIWMNMDATGIGARSRRRRWRSMIFAAALLGALSGSRLHAQAESTTIELTGIRIHKAASATNWIDNGGFEKAASSGMPAGWEPVQAESGLEVRAARGAGRNRGAAWSLKPRRAGESSAHGALVYSQPIPREPGQPNILSVWVKSSAGGEVFLGDPHASGRRLYLPNTEGQWRQVSCAWTNPPLPGTMGLMLGVERLQGEFLLDDLRWEAGLEPGWEAPGLISSDPGIVLEAVAEQADVQGEGPWTIRLWCGLGSAKRVAWRALFMDGSAETQLPDAPIEAGIWRIELTGRSSRSAQKWLVLQAREGERRLAEAKVSARFHSSETARQLEGEIDSAMGRMAAEYERVTTHYPAAEEVRVSWEVLRAGREVLRRQVAARQVLAAERLGRELEEVAERLGQEMREIQAGLSPAVAPPRWNGRHRPQTWSSAFLAMTQTNAQQTPEVRPVFFLGIPPMEPVPDAIQSSAAMGGNLIGWDIDAGRWLGGSSAEEASVIEELKSLLDGAQRARMCVSLGLPTEWPARAAGGAGPARAESEGESPPPEGGGSNAAPPGYVARLTNLVAAVARHPALLSVGLMSNGGARPDLRSGALAEWRLWLEKKHGDISTLNRRWGTRHGRFADVPWPRTVQGQDPAPSGPGWDFGRFGWESDAARLERLADAMREVAFDLPIHAVWPSPAQAGMAGREDFLWLGSRFGDLHSAGGDWAWEGDAGLGMATDWLAMGLALDRLRSMKAAPVFGRNLWLPMHHDWRMETAEHIRSTLWLAALHGLSAAWLWPGPVEGGWDTSLPGNLGHRPGCLEAIGRIQLDLHRAAEEIGALQNAPLQVQIACSDSAVYWGDTEWGEALHAAYQALIFSGVTVGFLSERALEKGALPSTPIVIVPGMRHLSDAACATLRRHRGDLVFVGDGPFLTHDEYHQERRELVSAAAVFPAKDLAGLRARLGLLLRSWGREPEVKISEITAAGRQTPWGIGWRAASTSSREVLALWNCRPESVSVQIAYTGLRPDSMRDAWSGAECPAVVALPAFGTRMLEWEIVR